MEQHTQKEIAKILIELLDVMDFLDDGHHNREYFEIVKISHRLFSRLNATNQKKFQEWVRKKMEDDLA